MSGISTRRSRYGFDETVTRLQAAIESHGVKVFALIDHAGEAARVGLTMPPTKLLIFGSPRAGTPLMLTAPTLPIDLPLKILVSQTADGSVTMAYSTVAYLADRHNVPQSQSAALAAPEALTAALAEPGPAQRPND